MEKLVKALSLALDEAEKHDVDLVLAQMCWNYNNTTTNFRRIAERVGSPRLKLLWGPADNLNCGEVDVASTGFDNVRPYLIGLHTKDLRVTDGINLNFEYLPFGEGDVGYPTLLGKMFSHGADAVLAITPHYLPPDGTAVDAMRTCFGNLQEMTGETQRLGVSQPAPQTAD
jgi:L-ribulose-5-phosphate 3-epimerase UlaE